MRYTNDLQAALGLYAVTDRRYGSGTLAARVEQALQGGVTLLQLREKELPQEDFIRETREIGRLTAAYGVPLIVNDCLAAALFACSTAAKGMLGGCWSWSAWEPY